MNKIWKIIIGVVAIVLLVGGCFMFLHKDIDKSKSVSSGGQEVTLVNGEKSVKLNLPKANQLKDSSSAVIGYLDLTKEEEAKRMEQQEAAMQVEENEEEIPEIMNDIVQGKDYSILDGKGVYEISITLKNGVIAKYELSDVVYTKEVLENISEDVKDAKFGDNEFMYTSQSQSDYNFYYMVCNKIENQSMFVVIVSPDRLSEDNLVNYMNAIQF